MQNDSNCLNLDKDRSAWQQVVSHFATPNGLISDDLREEVLRADSVFGPISDNRWVF